MQLEGSTYALHVAVFFTTHIVQPHGPGGYVFCGIMRFLPPCCAITAEVRELTRQTGSRYDIVA